MGPCSSYEFGGRASSQLVGMDGGFSFTMVVVATTNVDGGDDQS